MDNKAFYFPWVRKGLGGHINEKETLDGEAKGRPELTIRTDYTVQHNQQRMDEDEETTTEMRLEKTVKFVGPGDILRVNRSAIMKIHPEQGSEDFATESIPYLEFWEPDFLWRYTPAVHDNDRLRPWLALVAFRKEDVKLMTDSEGFSSFTFIGDGQAWERSFPNINDLFRTAHAQGSAEDRPELCRLLGMRNGDSSLEPHAEYVALLIPSYETGRLRGLGYGEEDIQKTIAQQPAWEQTLDKQKERPRGLEFPVYYKWSFKAGGESFDQLADKLAPCSVQKPGLKLDVTDMGEGFSYRTVGHKGNRTDITMPAATVTSDFSKQPAFPARSGNSDEGTLYTNLKTLMEENPVFAENRADRLGDYSLQEEGDDPLVAPPVYGARHAMTTGLNDPTNPKPWLEEVNMDIHHRAAAGLGRKVVQKHQEEFMDRAWKQVEAVQALNMELYKRLLSIRTNQALQRKTVDGFDDSARYVAYMMRYLSSMKNAGADKYTLADIIKNADIPASFAAPSFQNNVEKLSRIVSGLDPTSLMERIVKDQIFKFTSPDPAGSLDLERHITWCKKSIEGLIYQTYKSDWEEFYEAHFNNGQLDFTPIDQYHGALGGDLRFKDEAWDRLSYVFYHIESVPARKPDYYGNEYDAYKSIIYNLRRYDSSQISYPLRVFVLPDASFDNFGTATFRVYNDEVTLGSQTLPLYSFSIPADKYDRFFNPDTPIVRVGTEKAAHRFVRQDYSLPDIRSIYSNGTDHPFLGKGTFDTAISSFEITHYLSDAPTIEEGRLRDFFYHFYYYNLSESFPSVLNRFVDVYKSVLAENNISASFASTVFPYNGEEFVRRGDYDFFYKKERQRYERKVNRYNKAIQFFQLGFDRHVTLYNNIKDGSLLRILALFLNRLLHYPGLMGALWKKVMGKDTILANLCYTGEESLSAGLLTLLVTGAAGDETFLSIKGKLMHFQDDLDIPTCLIIPQRQADKFNAAEGRTTLRECIIHSTPEVGVLENAIGLAKKMKENVTSGVPATEPVRAISDDAVEKHQQSIVNQSTDEEDAYARIRKVAGMYYKMFFSDTQEGERLRNDYLDKLLLSKYPILAYPFFPEPTYYYLKMISDKFIIPGLDEIDPETVAMFISNPQFTEAFLCGMNTEMGSELQWREYPTDRRGSYFRKFWDSDSSVEAITGDKFFDVSPLHLWDKPLGENHLSGKGHLLIFAIHSKLLQLYPSTRIYLNKAKMKAGSTTELDFAEGRLDPTMETFIREGLLLVGFNISLPEALGNPDSGNYGYMLTFEQDVDDLEFQYNENNTLWRRDLSSDSAGNLIDTPSKFGKHVSLFVQVKE